jgi:hypothetical protein
MNQMNPTLWQGPRIGQTVKSTAPCRAQPWQNCRAYRSVPAGTAWYRLVPDKIFLRAFRTGNTPDRDGGDRYFPPRFFWNRHFSRFRGMALRKFRLMRLKSNRLQMIPDRALQLIDFSLVTGIFHFFSRYFTPFLSHNCMIFRRLRIYQGLIARFN